MDVTAAVGPERALVEGGGGGIRPDKTSLVIRKEGPSPVRNAPRITIT